MGSWPKDLAASRTLKKRLEVLRDKGKDKMNCNFRRDGYEDDVTICTTIVPLMGHVEIDLEVPMELAQLSFDQVAHDQGMPTTKELAQCQTSISCKQPAMFAHHTLDQCFVRDHLFVGGVVAENAEPACEATEHRIGHEALDRLGWFLRAAHQQDRFFLLRVRPRFGQNPTP